VILAWIDTCWIVAELLDVRRCVVGGRPEGSYSLAPPYKEFDKPAVDISLNMALVLSGRTLRSASYHDIELLSTCIAMSLAQV
jgi:hypothetical protein